MMINRWKTLSSARQYENRWIAVTEHQVINPSGNPGIYGVVHFKNWAVAVLPLDDNLNTWIVGQWRYTLSRYEWEIPEGGCPEGTSPEDTARRELREETGIEAGELIPVLEMQLSNSTTDEISYSFIARNLEMREAQPEDTEDIQVKQIPFKELVEMVMKGEIRDALSVATILKVNYMLEKGLL